MILGIVSSILFIGCNDYLDESPDDRLELDTLDKAAKVVARAYSQGSYAFTDMMSDLAGPTGNFPRGGGIPPTAGGNTIREQDRQLYAWQTVEAIFQETPTFYWNSAYEAIAHANEVLAVINGLTGDEERKRAIKGEALLARAYHHFMLVNLFGLHYDNDASSNLGVPYITEPETEFLPVYKRSTVKEVYDLVEKDLLEGLSLVNDKFYIGTKKYHFTVKAAQAFASRFYLWKGDYENCIKYSNIFLGGNPTFFIKDFESTRAPGYIPTAENYASPEDPSNLLVMQQFSLWGRINVGFRLNNDEFNALFSNPFGATDIRADVGGSWTSGTDATSTARLREYFFRENLSSNSGSPYLINVELKGEEVLLNRSEAYIKLGGLTSGLDDLNILLDSRYGLTLPLEIVPQLVPIYDVTTPEDALIELILEERKKEFLDHGLRWFDIKRYDIPLTHQLPVSEGGQLLELPAGDLRRAIQIPADAIAQGLVQNPR